MSKITPTIHISIAKAIKNIVSQIETNIYLIGIGERPISLDICGPPGLGKTSIFKHIADNYRFDVTNENGVVEKRKIRLISKNAGQFADEADVAGILTERFFWKLKGTPLKQLQMMQYKNEFGDADEEYYKQQVFKLKDTLILPRGITPYFSYLYEATGKTRMGYSIPTWLPSEVVNSDESSDTKYIDVILFDDVTRANDTALNALMPLILERKTISYSLPKYSMIFTTSNPDDGDSKVSALDIAQTTRFVQYHIKFSQIAWDAWALQKESFTNTIYVFLKNNPELINTTVGEKIFNPRVWENINNTLILDILALERCQSRNDLNYNKIRDVILDKLSESTNTLVSESLRKFLSNNFINIPSMTEFMETWSDAQVKSWMGTHIGVQNSNMNLGLSLVVSDKIFQHIKTSYLSPGKTFNTELFNRFIRLFWEKHMQGTSKTLGQTVSLDYLAEAHNVLLAKRVSSLINIGYDSTGAPISQGSKKWKSLEKIIMNPLVTAKLTNMATDEFFESFSI
jgi:hypothetical protein